MGLSFSGQTQTQRRLSGGGKIFHFCCCESQWLPSCFHFYCKGIKHNKSSGDKEEARRRLAPCHGVLFPESCENSSIADMFSVSAFLRLQTSKRTVTSCINAYYIRSIQQQCCTVQSSSMYSHGSTVTNSVRYFDNIRAKYTKKSKRFKIHTCIGKDLKHFGFSQLQNVYIKSGMCKILTV